jgi:hypothetical protein
MDDRFKKLKDKLGAAVNTITSPVDTNDYMDDPTTLPNQKLAEEGGARMLQAFGEIQPDEEDMPEIAPGMKFDPTALIGTMGSVAKLPKQGLIKAGTKATAEEIAHQKRSNVLARLTNRAEQTAQRRGMKSIPVTNEQIEAALAKQAQDDSIPAEMFQKIKEFMKK